MTPFYLVGWLLLGAGLVVAQTRFYDAHRSVHHLWRPLWRPHLWRPREEVGPTTLFYTSTERRAMLRATFHADEDGNVERERHRYIAIMALAGAYLALVIPLAMTFGT